MSSVAFWRLLLMSAILLFVPRIHSCAPRKGKSTLALDYDPIDEFCKQHSKPSKATLRRVSLVLDFGFVLIKSIAWFWRIWIWTAESISSHQVDASVPVFSPLATLRQALTFIADIDRCLAVYFSHSTDCRTVMSIRYKSLSKLT